MKLWGGRFTKSAADIVDAFNASIEYDQKLYKEDIQGSIAHSKMLSKVGILTTDEQKTIEEGLLQILTEIESGDFEFSVAYEDIHMNIEKVLTDRIGILGKKLHTARSRNDQVALDLKLYMKTTVVDMIEQLDILMLTLVNLANDHTETMMPGYTHLQCAQPITLGYHLMAYFQMFKRDKLRLESCLEIMDLSPLGAGAMAGVSYETDRHFLANELGFAGVTENAMDSVSDRDHVIEFLSDASIIMMHLSRFCEELILWSTSEYKFIEMDDAYSTGSSIMPQKKNPDVAELIRGKTGRVYGNLMALLTVMKGLPLAYNKDMQEDKEPLFDTVETLDMCLKIFVEMIASMNVNKDNMKTATQKGYMNATDVADYIAKKGIGFRTAHEIVGKMVLYCITNNKNIDDLTLEEFKTFSDVFDESILSAVTIESCIQSKASYGSTSKKSVDVMIANAKAYLNA